MAIACVDQEVGEQLKRHSMLPLEQPICRGRSPLDLGVSEKNLLNVTLLL